MRRERPPSPEIAPTVDLTIDEVAFGGDGVARHEGMVVFVPFTALGEEVSVRLTERKKHHGKGRAVKIVKPSAHRVEPPCPYFTRCGGCQYQHVDYQEELRWKQAQVRSLFARIAKLLDVEVRPVIASPSDYGYRNRITLHAELGRVGFRAVDGHTLVDIEQCLIAMPSVNDSLRELRARRPREGHFSLRAPEIPRSAFFQANHFLLETLRETVLAAMPATNRFAVDAYSGGGFFTVELAKRAEKVCAIESDPRAVHDLQRGLAPNVSILAGSVETHLHDALKGFVPAETTLILDPPREGLGVGVASTILHHQPAAIVYVSCDPATLARDTRLLAERYRLRYVQPLDMFPRTAQIECVIALELLP